MSIHVAVGLISVKRFDHEDLHQLQNFVTFQCSHIPCMHLCSTLHLCFFLKTVCVSLDWLLIWILLQGKLCVAISFLHFSDVISEIIDVLPPTDTVSWSTVQNCAPMTTVQRIGMLCVLVLGKYTHRCTCMHTHMYIYTQSTFTEPWKDIPLSVHIM